MGDETKDKQALIDSDLWPVFFAGLALAWVLFLIALEFVPPVQVLIAEHEAFRNYVLAIGGPPIAIFGLWLTYRRTKSLEDQNKNTLRSLEQQEKQSRSTRLATAFTSAVEQLGHDKAHVRAGACHTLTRIAIDDAQNYYGVVIQILCSFLRSQAREVLLQQNGYDDEAAFEERAKALTRNTPQPHATSQEQLETDLHWARGARPPHDIEAAIQSLSNLNSKTPSDSTEFGEISEMHPIDLQGADLRCFAGLKASICLKNADLRNANFENAWLPQCDLSNTRLDFANFRGAFLANADLSDASAQFVHFGYANLEMAVLERVKFEFSAFEDATANAINAQGSEFVSCHMHNTKLLGAILSNCAFKKLVGNDLDASGATFEGSDLTESNFSNSNLSKADMTSTNLAGCIFTGSNMFGLNLSKSRTRFDSNLENQAKRHALYATRAQISEAFFLASSPPDLTCLACIPQSEEVFYVGETAKKIGKE